MMWAKLLAASALATAIAHASTLTPPVLPLLVRNPYLSLWLGNARGEPWEQWPMFYTGAQVDYTYSGGELGVELMMGIDRVVSDGCRARKWVGVSVVGEGA